MLFRLGEEIKFFSSKSWSHLTERLCSLNQCSFCTVPYSTGTGFFRVAYVVGSHFKFESTLVFLYYIIV